MSGYRREMASRLYYVGLFALFGLLIAFSSSFIHYRLDIASLERELEATAGNVYERKISILESYTEGLENIVVALRDTSLLYQYIIEPSPENYELVATCFEAVTNSNASLMQVRYIDESGMERVRVDWPKGLSQSTLLPLRNLQDKQHRYYFKEASEIPPFSFWFSKLDLNIENGKIESPEKPVLRVASPIYVAQKFRGIVIINVHMKDFLEKFSRDSIFKISIIDRDGYFLVSHDSEKSWSRYRRTEFTVDSGHPDHARSILDHLENEKLRKFDDFFVGFLGRLLEKDGASLILHADDNIVQGMKEERQKAAVLIIAIILLLSVPLALLISRGPTKLHKKISRQNRRLSESMDVIDRNVIRGSLSLDRTFQEVSSAFASTLGVEKSSLLGTKYDSIYCNVRPKEYYDDVWDSLDRDGVWEGELQHSKSNGECYWADTIVVEKTDDEGTPIGYSVIHQDITDKKRIEQISITDEMTGLYNRRFFNVIIEKELGRARRESHELVFAMLDIDFFKQYNDNYGHQKGDEILIQVSAIMSDMLSRGSDYCFRLGGEEFGILFTNEDTSNSFDFVDSIRRAIEGEAIEHKWSAVAGVVTVSGGMYTIAPGDVVPMELLYQNADKALYAAKGQGRNRIVVSSSDRAEM